MDANKRRSKEEGRRRKAKASAHDGTGPGPVLVTSIVVGTMAIGPYINYVFSALAPYFVETTAITSGDIGIIVTVIFGVATFSSAAAGRLSDRRGPVWASKLLLGLAAGSLVAITLGGSMVTFLTASVLAGLAHALSHPTSNDLVATSVVAARRGLVVGLKQSGVQVGQFVAGFLLPLTAPLIGWRWSVSSGFLLIFLTFIALRSLESRMPTRSSSRPEKRRQVPTASASWLAVYAVVLGTAVQGTNVYLSLFAFAELGYTARSAGLVVGLVGGAGVVARIGWGVWASRLATIWKPLSVVALLVLCSVGLFWTAIGWGTPIFAAGVLLFVVGATAVSVLLSIALIQSSKSQSLGGDSGVVMRGLYAGYMAGPFLFGQTVEFSGYPAAWGLMASFATVAVILGVTSIRSFSVWHSPTVAREA